MRVVNSLESVSWLRAFFPENCWRGLLRGRFFGRIENAGVEEARPVWNIESDEERIGGPTQTMGGQNAGRADDTDIGADTEEAGASTQDRYRKGPEQGKGTR